MIKQLSFTLVFCVSLFACGDKTNNEKPVAKAQEASSSTKQATAETSVENGEDVALDDQDILAMDILNEEIFLDECTAYSLEDKVKEPDMKAYLSDCVEQLKLEASIIYDAQSDAEAVETTPTEKVAPAK